MSDNSKDTNDCSGFFVPDSYVSVESYQMLHRELTKLAYKFTRDWEAAKDIASECLIHWWQQTVDNGQVQPDKKDVIKTIVTLFECNRTCNQQRRISEHCFMQEQMASTPMYKAFRIAEKEVVLQLSRSLQPPEQTVIEFILIDGFDLPEISEIMKKSVPSIKILQDRAAFQLRKKLLQSDCDK